MLRRVALPRTNVSEERIASIIGVEGTSELGTSAVTITQMMEAIRSSETLVLARITLRNIPDNDIVHRRWRENLRSY
jgi:hypothetical protein